MSAFEGHAYLQKPTNEAPAILKGTETTDFVVLKSRIDNVMTKFAPNVTYEVKHTDVKDGRNEITGVRIVLKNTTTGKETGFTIAIEECPPEYPLEDHLKNMIKSIS